MPALRPLRVCLLLLVALTTAAAWVACGAQPTQPLPQPTTARAPVPLSTAEAGPRPVVTPCAAARFPTLLEEDPWPVSAVVSHPSDQGLQAVLEGFAPLARGHASIAVVDVTRGRSAALDADRHWYGASLYKLPLAIEATWRQQRGALPDELELTCIYTEGDLGTLEGLGLAVGSTVHVDEAVRYVLVASDNALAQLLSDALGPAQVDAQLRRLGLTVTSVSERTLPTTAREMAQLLAATALESPSASVSTVVLDLLSEQWMRERIPSGITETDVLVANKTGDWPGLVAHDVALVRAGFGTYALAILTDGSLDDDFFTEVAARVHAYLRAVSAPKSSRGP